MTGLPASLAVEVQFAAGVWTDVTPWMEPSPLTIHIGRTSVYSQPGAGTLDGLQLRNADGRFTPLRQVLTDGATPHPYYPHVEPYRLIRVRYSAGGTRVRFLGRVKAWSPSWGIDGQPVVTVSAVDRLDRLAKGRMPSALGYAVQAINADLGPYYPLTERAGAVVAVAADGQRTLTQATYGGSGGLVAWGQTGVHDGNGTGVTFAPASIADGQTLRGDATWATGKDFAVAVWIRCPKPTVQITILAFDGYASVAPPPQFGIDIDTNGHLVYRDASYSVTYTDIVVSDDLWHMVAFTRTISGTRSYISMTVDGQVVGTTIATDYGVGHGYTAMYVGGPSPDADYVGYVYAGDMGYVACWSAPGGGGVVTNFPFIYQAGLGFRDDLTGEQVYRFLDSAGVDTADEALDTGVETCRGYDWTSSDVLAACQAMATTEGQGSVFYCGPDGQLRFRDRTFRSETVALTLDAERDLDGGTYTPDYSDTQLVNAATCTRAYDGGSVTVQDHGSEVAYGRVTSDVTSYSSQLDYVRRRAQSELAGQPGFRLDQVALDLMTAQTDYYAALSGVEIGSRIRIVGLPDGQTPATTLDLYVEGWTETIAPDQYTVVWDTSPADNPPHGRWDAFRWQTSDSSLYAAIAANSGSNLCPNGTFETSVAGWTPDAGSSVTRDTSTSHTDAASMRYDTTASGQVVRMDPTAAAAAATAYTGAVWISGSGSVAVQISFLNASLVPVGYGSSDSGALSGTWHQYISTGTAPAGTAHVGIEITTLTAGSHSMYIDDVTLGEGSTPLAGLTLVIESLTTPWTMDSAQYPLDIIVEREIMTLTAPPSGASSPQTFAGVLRGQGGTWRAGHVIHTPVYVQPPYTWAL